MQWPDPVADGAPPPKPFTQDEEELFEALLPSQPFNLPDARRQRRQQRENAKTVMRRQLTQLEPKLDRYTRGTATNRNGEKYQIRFEKKDVPQLIDLTEDDPLPVGRNTIQTSFILPQVTNPYGITQTRIPVHGEEVRVKMSSDSDPNRVIIGRVQRVSYNQTARKRTGMVTLSNLSVATSI